ncbi:MAG: amino acid adenylation domain-containing protein [Ferruginibacter sp.]|nr:amino acid adenylation domain-containing protein [Cytophagales bacterium]
MPTLLMETPAAPREETAPEESRFPLSPHQEGLWFLQQMAPDLAAYNVVFAVRVRSAIDTGALAQAFQQLVARHAALRTTFTTSNGQPVQRIHSRGESAFRTVEVAGCAESEVEELVRAETKRAFSLENDAPLRVCVFTRSAREHVLVLTAHHIAVDFWSLALLLSELHTRYPALAKGQTVSLPPVGATYADFTSEQTGRLAKESGPRLREYWGKQLAGEKSVLNLPTDRPHPPVQTYHGAVHRFQLDAGLSDQLKALARQEGVTLYVVLLSAFQILLHRYAQEETILVGTPVAGRTKKKYQDVIGNFVNTVVLKASFPAGITGRQLLHQVGQTVVEAIRHQDYPFSELVKQLQPARDPSRSPFVQANFAWERLPQWKALEGLFVPNAAGEPVDFGGLLVEPYFVAQQEGQYELNLEMGGEVAGALLGIFKYNTDLFHPATIARTAGHFQTLLRGLVSRVECPVGHLPLLTEAESEQILVDWNRTAAAYPVGGCLHTLFERQVHQTPDRTAVSFGATRLTYRELDGRANQMANYLLRHGVGPEVFVGICLDRSPDVLVALLGVLKAGGTYIPLDPAYPKERLSFMVADAGLPIVVSQRKWVDEQLFSGVKTVCLDSDWALIGQESRLAPADPGFDVDEPDAERLAYVIYTSGSTGQPKGVQIPHRSVVNFLHSTTKETGMTERDRLLAVTTLSFDIAGLELFMPLLVGAQVVLASRAEATDGHKLAEKLTSEEITFLQATPSTWRLLLEAGWTGKSDLKAIAGGEALPFDLAQSLRERTAAFWNMYGPTETTIWSTAWKADETNGVIPIGRPIDNTEIYLLDAHLQPVPVGVPGELHIGGLGLAHGYLNRPELTAEKFIPHPFRRSPRARLYKTGDLACYLPDGTIKYLGRGDNQVKLRGFRIELGEIEAVLCGHPQLRQAVVKVREDRPNDKRLVAYLIPAAPDEPVDSAELRHFLKEKLPDYMVPSAFVTLDAFPMTPNGKINSPALPAPASHQPGSLVSPRDVVELQLGRLWEEILDTQPIGVTDNFFELGGHSLLAVRLVNDIKRRFDQDLPVSILFEKPTIEQLAEVLRQQAGTGEYAPLVVLRKGDARAPLFCPHPIGGNVFCYTSLVRHLAPEQPVYGLQVKSLYQNEVPHVAVEDMAAEYVKAIQSVQPRGPYLLAGWCFGGLIAFEIAQQLRQSGEEIALLALLDTRAPILEEEEVYDDAHLLSLFARDLAVPYGKKLTISPQELRAVGTDAMFGYVLERAKQAEVQPPDADAEQLYRYFQVYVANALALQGYSWQPYAGTVKLLRATEEPLIQSLGLALGWDRGPIRELEIHDVAGDHNSMMYNPNVQALAQLLTRFLKEAQPQPRPVVGPA